MSAAKGGASATLPPERCVYAAATCQTCRLPRERGVPILQTNTARGQCADAPSQRPGVWFGLRLIRFNPLLAQVRRKSRSQVDWVGEFVSVLVTVGDIKEETLRLEPA